MKILASMFLVSAAAVFSMSTASAADLTQKDFEMFAETRFGPPDGKPRYWYGKGPVRDANTGKTIYIFEYYDTVRHVIDPRNPNKRYGIVRKLDLFRDKDTNEVLKTFHGNPVKQWTFPYQLLELEYKDGKVMLTVTQGAGEWVRTHTFPDSNIERYGDFAHVTFQGFFTTRRPEVPDRVVASTMTSMFATCEKNCTGSRYVWNQSGVSPVPPWAAVDGAELRFSSMSGTRFENYSDLPKELRDVIDTQYPEYREPAKDLDEVRALQR